MDILISDLNPIAAPQRDHLFGAIREGESGYLTVGQALGLIEKDDIPPEAVAEVIAAAEADDAVDDTDTVIYLTGDAVKKSSLTGLISSIFKTARTIANGRFAAASFRLFNAAGTPRALSFAVSALTADRTLTLPDADVDLTAAQKLSVSGAPPAYACRAWVHFDGTGTPSIKASGNVSSLTDHGNGDYSVNTTTAMPDNNYAVMVTAGGTNSGNNLGAYESSSTARTASLVRVFVHSAGVGVDVSRVSVAIFR